MYKPAKTSNESKFVEEKRREQQLMHDVLLSLENLIYREEITVKLILDYLYDVGSINLINQRFHSRTLNRTLKLISKTSKPIFKILAWRWFKKNCPELITDWLHSKVVFKSTEKPKTAPTQLVLENPDTSFNSLAKTQYQIQEVKHLRSQVKLLTGILAGVVTLFGGSFLWFGYSLERSNLQMQRIEELQTQVKTLEANVNQR
ncbi:hypothetical protein IQ243_00120 [Nostocales cyanobacterium LEGE 11386]|nr:hypothetical protein [Nostocales cyanobacterium LEGE 11386]